MNSQHFHLPSVVARRFFRHSGFGVLFMGLAALSTGCGASGEGLEGEEMGLGAGNCVVEGRHGDKC